MTKQTAPDKSGSGGRRKKSLDPMIARRTSNVQLAPSEQPVGLPPRPKSMDVHPKVPRRKALIPDAEQAAQSPVGKKNSAEVAERSIQTTQKQATAEDDPQPQDRNVRRALLYGFAGLLFVTGAAVSLYGLRANHQAEAQVKQGQQQTEDAVSDDVVPTTDKPSTDTIKNYTVAPNLPKYLDIPNLKIHTRILSEGVTKSGKLQVPWNIYDTGWYNASAQPGQSGAMLIDGHSGIGKTHGVFHDLGGLAVGDSMMVTRGDGRTFTYTVAGVQIVDVNKVDMSSMMVSSDLSKPGLNLITCAGDVIPGTNELNKRILVHAVLQ